VTAAIAFARALHLDVTAEGVETPDQAIRLRALGCDRAQGYLFARPMDEAALDAILREGGLSALTTWGRAFRRADSSGGPEGRRPFIPADATLLGSVARNVVQGSRASVLIVHGPDRGG
jgi:hypothetical protein